MREIQLLLTFDYELPLGSCKNYDIGLFQPTEKLLELTKQNNVPIVLFADICSFELLKEHEYEKYVIPFQNQLQKALNFKHDVQLHIHPHWLKSEYIEGSYIPSSYYSLSSYIDEKPPFDIESIIKNAINDLTNICKEVDPDYRCVAYRGGGYNIQPNTNLIFSTLYKYGIRIDSSVVKNYFLKTAIQGSDYRNTPKSANWFIGLESGDISKEATSGMFEIPVTGMPPFLSQRISRIIKKVKNKNLYKQLAYDHSGTGYIGAQPDKISKIISGLYSPFVFTFDNLTTDIKLIESIIDYNLRNYKGDFIMCANSHPKCWGNYQFELFKQFLELVKTKYSDSIEITTFQEIVKKKGL